MSNLGPVEKEQSWHKISREYWGFFSSLLGVDVLGLVSSWERGRIRRRTLRGKLKQRF